MRYRARRLDRQPAAPASPASSIRPNDVAGEKPDDVWAVGAKFHAWPFQNNTQFAMNWDGNQWTEVPYPNAPPPSAATIAATTGRLGPSWLNGVAAVFGSVVAVGGAQARPTRSAETCSPSSGLRRGCSILLTKLEAVRDPLGSSRRPGVLAHLPAVGVASAIASSSSARESTVSVWPSTKCTAANERTVASSGVARSTV